MIHDDACKIVQFNPLFLTLFIAGPSLSSVPTGNFDRKGLGPVGPYLTHGYLNSMKGRDRALRRSLGSRFDLYNDYKRGSWLCSFWTATHQCKRRRTELRRSRQLPAPTLQP